MSGLASHSHEAALLGSLISILGTNAGSPPVLAQTPCALEMILFLPKTIRYNFLLPLAPLLLPLNFQSTFGNAQVSSKKAGPAHIPLTSCSLKVNVIPDNPLSHRGSGELWPALDMVKWGLAGGVLRRH